MSSQEYKYFTVLRVLLFFISTVLFAFGYAYLNGFHWILFIPFLLLAIPNLNNKQAADRSNKEQEIKKGIK